MAAAVAETFAYLHGLDDVPDATSPGMAHGGVAPETIRVTDSPTHLLDVPLGPVRQSAIAVLDGLGAASLVDVGAHRRLGGA